MGSVKAQHLMLLGAVSQMTPEEQAVINKLVQEIRDLTKDNGDAGLLALALVSLENAGD